MGETDKHRQQIINLIQPLESRYAGSEDVYVSGNLLVFYEPGNRRRHLSPDVMVVFGVAPVARENYLLWEEKAPPAVVIEVTSKSTRHEDMVKKKDLYLQFGVREYYLFDPLGEYLNPRLRGFHNVDGAWVPLHGQNLFSPSLELHLQVIHEELRFVDPANGEILPTAREVERQKYAAESRAEAAESRAAAAEAELARLRCQRAEPTAE